MAEIECKTWSRFVAKTKGGNFVKLRIQDLPLERKDDAIEFLINYYLKEEAFQRAAGIYNNDEAIKVYRGLMNSLLVDPKTHSVVCCIDNDPYIVGEIIGLSFMQVSKNTETIKDFSQGMDLLPKEMQNLFHILEVLEDYVGEKPYETCYSGRGIVVHPEYRGLGVSNEFVRVRKLICVEQNVLMTVAWMTAVATQKAAEKYNWKTFSEISLDDIEKLTGLTFDKNIPSFKLMYTTTDTDTL